MPPPMPSRQAHPGGAPARCGGAVPGAGTAGPCLAGGHGAAGHSPSVRLVGRGLGPLGFGGCGALVAPCPRTAAPAPGDCPTIVAAIVHALAMAAGLATLPRRGGALFCLLCFSQHHPGDNHEPCPQPRAPHQPLPVPTLPERSEDIRARSWRWCRKAGFVPNVSLVPLLPAPRSFAPSSPTTMR